MRPLLALLLVLSSCHAVRTNRTKAPPAKADFLRALTLARQAGRGGRFVVLDVGANNGKWMGDRANHGVGVAVGRLALGVVTVAHMGEAERAEAIVDRIERYYE